MKALAGFKFADTGSLLNAERAMNPDRPAAFLISGPPMSGKTVLANRILARVFGCVPGACSVSTGREMIPVVDRAADLGFLFLENVNSPRRLRDQQLLAFLTSEAWQFRRKGKLEPTLVANNCLTIITTQRLAGFPSDILTRVKLISLSAR